MEENNINDKLNINFEYTSVSTPQQNGVVGRAFANLNGRIRVMLNKKGFKGAMKQKLLAECAMVLTFLDGILIKWGEKKMGKVL